ncbi:MBL fold metallo-hydrolase [Amycolatopsis thermalba]|uniref:MBL fold metallo-hydrolase n=1 Tax=Amycolatopsis thermalba TaxID=944492 RepID=A0ABY4NZU1_9PSEU|nr:MULTISPECIES: MBL fold metallo-hydrolase [Amycolatopsis]UQS25516.1 MBL fold metallo-hydrolase [Amycolatopsis thermalba]
MSTVDVVPLVDEGLGNSAYLVDLGDGRALVVDVSLDLRAARHAAGRRGLRLAFAADTHLHADFVSGARQLAVTDGARVLASAAGHREYTHDGLHDGDETDLGGLRLRALFTPGHTHEHLSFLLLDGDAPVGVFTGGSLIVGAAARTDLVDPARTGELARHQYASLRRLATLPDEVAVWPTHGAGSFCSAPPGARRTSTIGTEKATNTLLRAENEDAFAAALLESLGSFPSYFRELADTNRRGVVLPGDPTLPRLDVDRVRALCAGGAVVVDARPAADFAAGHLPGALSNPLRPAFASWLGWLVPSGRPIVVVRGADQDPAEIAWQAVKIGRTDLAGELHGGLDAWTAAGHPVRRTPVVSPAGIGRRPVLDVRQDGEFAAGHLPGARHRELGSLDPRELPKEPLVVMCGHGERAMSAASLLEQAGHREVAVLTGGPADWARATGNPLVTGT